MLRISLSLSGLILRSQPCDMTTIPPARLVVWNQEPKHDRLVAVAALSGDEAALALERGRGSDNVDGESS